MYVSCIIGFLVIFIYCLYMCIKVKGLPHSISATVYELSPKATVIFTLVMYVVGFSLVPLLMETISEPYKFLGFLTIGGLLGVGADPLRRDSSNIVHNVSAGIMAVCSQLVILLHAPFYMLIWIPYVAYTALETTHVSNTFLSEVTIMVMMACWLLI